MLGCRRKSRQNTIQLLAWAPRSCALANTGTDRVKVTSCEGTNWYFNENKSWGFAKEGDDVDKNTCDTSHSGHNNLRLCWHAPGTGYRCGSELGSNIHSDYERVIFQTGKK